MMKKKTVLLQVLRRASATEDIRTVHERFVTELKGRGGVLGLPELFEDTTPVVDKGELVAVHFLKIPNSGHRLTFAYKFRSEKFLIRDSKKYDDVLSADLKIDSESYESLLRYWLPVIARAFGAYRAVLTFSDLFLEFTDWGWNEWSGRPCNNPGYHRLKESGVVEPDGRNNIFTLAPAMFLDNSLCERALGYGPDGVAARLRGEVPFIEVLPEGVHVIFNEKFHLSYEEYVDLNERFGKLLGIARDL